MTDTTADRQGKNGQARPGQGQGAGGALGQKRQEGRGYGDGTCVVL